MRGCAGETGTGRIVIILTIRHYVSSWAHLCLLAGRNHLYREAYRIVCFPRARRARSLLRLEQVQEVEIIFYKRLGDRKM